MTFGKIASVALVSLALVACEGTQGHEKQTMGTLIGAGLGALAGSQVGGGKGQLAAVAVGALAGAWLGGEAGKSLDKADQAYMQRNAQDSLEYNRTGQVSAWQNPDSGHQGQFTPTRTYQTAEGRNCRDFENTFTVDGKKETITGTACRQPDGTWRVVN